MYNDATTKKRAKKKNKIDKSLHSHIYKTYTTHTAGM